MLTFKDIMIKLKEIGTQNSMVYLDKTERNKINVLKMAYQRLLDLKAISIEQDAKTKPFNNDNERLTMLFFSRVINGLKEQYLNGQRLDYACLYVTNTSHEEISEVLKSLMGDNKLEFGYLEQLCIKKE